MGKDFADKLYEILLDTSLEDDVYRALADRTRRYAVYTLLEWNRVSMDELADVLTGWLHASEYRMATPTDRQQVVTELRHEHVEMLRKAGLASYDSNENRLVLPELSRPVDRLLRWARANEYSTDAN
ncbi:hypothetical protein [Haladaptatus sp. DYF46]|uniref:DUF7344 domain-containing protein n=1 Tax=Haladaptatus sp. DYF46 TaxID=2886041 RepID=UPI001E2E8F1A|nr:hypothetical protein [Haladaptatus sp. DYF46]